MAGRRKRSAGTSPAAAPSTAIVVAPPAPLVAAYESAETVSTLPALGSTAEYEEQLEPIEKLLATPGLAVTTEHIAWFNDRAHQFSEVHKAVKARRRQLCAKPERELEQINSHWMHIEKRAEELKKQCARRVAELEHVREGERRAALQAAAAAHVAGDTATAQAALAIVNNTSTEKTEGLSTKVVWRARVIDAELVAREAPALCTPDPAKMKAYCARYDVFQTPKIPGLEFYLDYETRVT